MFKIKGKITGQTGNNSTKNSFLEPLELSLINCEINLDLNWF